MQHSRQHWPCKCAACTGSTTEQCSPCTFVTQRCTAASAKDYSPAVAARCSVAGRQTLLLMLAEHLSHAHATAGLHDGRVRHWQCCHVWHHRLRVREGFVQPIRGKAAAGAATLPQRTPHQFHPAGCACAWRDCAPMLPARRRRRTSGHHPPLSADEHPVQDPPDWSLLIDAVERPKIPMLDGA